MKVRFITGRELAALAVAFVATVFAGHEFDLMEQIVRLVHGSESWQADEFVLALVVLCIGFGIVLYRRCVDLQRETTIRAASEARATASQQRFATVFASTPQPTMVMEVGTGRIIDANEAFEALTGRARGALVGRIVNDLGLWAEHEDQAEIARRLRVAGKLRDIESVFLCTDGSERQVLCSAVIADFDGVGVVILSATDITDRKRLENELEHQAFHDALTGLANRALFRDRAARALARAAHGGGTVATVFIDLDDFKRVNDALGHAAGDQLLQSVAARIASNARATDTVARLGGDEFAVLIEAKGGRAEANLVVDRIVAAIRQPVSVGDSETIVGSSVGLAFADADDDAGSLLRNADLAMYEAKSRGKDQLALFETAMHETALQRIETETGLRHALERGEFRLLYQPIVDLRTAKAHGVEALLRWEHPEKGTIAPGAFIPTAEQTGLILPIGRWVLDEACRQGARWLADRQAARDAFGDQIGSEPFTITVNVSGKQLADPGIVDDVANALEKSGLPASVLVLEITETVVMEDAALALDRMRALKALGVRLAVDDFGTGYSSLSYLRQFPFDILKIDRAFVSGVNAGGSEAALARTIIALADALSLVTIAEGVEEMGQRVQLRELGCELGQGYLFARPLSAGDAEAMLRATPDAIAA